MMEKKTAVQWFYEQILLTPLDIRSINKCLEQALEMEKEQMKDAYHEDRPFLWGYETGEFFEQYYNETYNNEQGK